MADLIIIYIAAAVVVVLLITFVALSVLLLAQRVSKSIRAKASELLSTYDEILEKKSLELKRLNVIAERKKAEIYRMQTSGTTVREHETREAADVQDHGNILSIAEKICNSSYHDNRLGNVYQKIRTEFSIDPVDVIRDLVPDVGEKGPATKILEDISYETVYQLSTLAAEDQITLLADTLDEEGIRLLQGFMSGRYEFNVIEFYDYLKNRSLTEPHPVLLRVSSAARIGWLPSGVTVQYDDDICEGFELEANNQLYDYCVRKSEIS